MGKPGAYLERGRVEHSVEPAERAVKSFDDFSVPLSLREQRGQASRCMYCGVAFCQSGIVFKGARRATGCPLHNLIPETNDLLYQGRLEDAAGRLALTNPFPEFTGRICPAPCEVACNLGLHEEPVTIRDDERAISDAQWEAGVKPLAPAPASARRATVVGSGPAGLAAAWELARTGWRVRVVERDDRPGGLLMYGIPNMKLPKEVVLRRIDLMEQSGIEFACGVDAAEQAAKILEDSDAIVIAAGARKARELSVPGAELDGIYPAMAYLEEATRRVLEGGEPAIDARGKDVVVIGGGDTGVDCIATALRQGARSVTQVIRAAKPPMEVDTVAVWPRPRGTYDVSYGQLEAAVLEGADPRVWSTDTIGFTGIDGAVSAVRLQDISYVGGRHNVEGSEHEVPAQLVLVAKGFTGPEAEVFEAFGVAAPKEGYRAESLDGSGTTPVYVAGDARTGSSIVASAIADALDCVHSM